MLRKLSIIQEFAKRGFGFALSFSFLLAPCIASAQHSPHTQISKDGTIQNLQLISGHPMLAPAAIEAVKQWKYKPYLLNGEPVEVDTQVQVNFTLAGG